MTTPHTSAPHLTREQTDYLALTAPEDTKQMAFDGATVQPRKAWKVTMNSLPEDIFVFASDEAEARLEATTEWLVEWARDPDDLEELQPDYPIVTRVPELDGQYFTTRRVIGHICGITIDYPSPALDRPLDCYHFCPDIDSSDVDILAEATRPDGTEGGV